MNATHTSLEVGVRTDATLEFVSRRTVELEEGVVHRLLVEDGGDNRIAVFVDPSSGLLAGLKTGESYQFSGLLVSNPHASNGGNRQCPDCEHALRPGVVADTLNLDINAAAAKLGIEECFGIVDDRTTLVHLGEEGAVDDWRAMNTGEKAVHAPDYVCEHCRRTVDERELWDLEDEEYEEFQQFNTSVDAAPAAQETVGLAAGGAKDVTNFRENVANGYTPQPEAISDEGLFYDYHFETGDGGGTDSEALFSPRYAAATSEHPLTGETEQFLSVGLDSTLAVDDFQRPRLDLVAVLDVSGSMSSQFDAYYYDEQGRKQKAEDVDKTTKLEAATQSLCALTEQLHDEDRLGVVLYNHRAHVAKPLRGVGTTDMPAIRRHIKDIAAGGSTNLEDGFEAAVDMLSAAKPTPTEEGVGPTAEQRVVFMTDMMPNAGKTDKSDLTDLFEDAAASGIHTTFVGMGLDANADLTDALSGIQGANHYFVQSAAEFERRLGDEFDYMVTPLVYDLSLELDGDGYEVVDIHGSPSAGDATKRLMHVNTLFPSAKQDGEAKGGVVLVQVEQTTQNAELELHASWTERDGSSHRESATVKIPSEPEHYDHDGIRKAIALTRYARLLRAWTQDVHERASTASGVDDWLLPDASGEHERESVPLVVPDKHARMFRDFLGYLETEMEILEDYSLQQELNLLQTLGWEQPSKPREVTNE
jgi:Ca-activated chloride channel family protein